MKLAVVVQRYGADINGGAELHARYVAEHAGAAPQVEVLTTCAHDYVTWSNDARQAPTPSTASPVRRFPVARERDPYDFGQRSSLVFDQPHSIADELAWLDSEGPTSPALIDYIGGGRGLRLLPVLQLPLLPRVARRARVPRQGDPGADRGARRGASASRFSARSSAACAAVMYNSPEERAMIQAAAGNTAVPGVVVGIGSDLPRAPTRTRSASKFGITRPVRDLRRPHRREQGLRASSSTISSTTPAAFRSGLDCC